jgi:flavin reductase (DIM6/NTAB) family NADH-FMN oxidoreductase RutF
VTVDPEALRDTLSRFASGVTVVTVAADGTLHGMTASSFASVSLDPPRVLVCLDKSSRTRALLADTFAINILSAEQEDISRAFAHAGEKRFTSLEHKIGASGAPLIHGALAWIECATSSIVDGGDHDIIIGDVTWCTSGEGQPLVYFARTYRALEN